MSQNWGKYRKDDRKKMPELIIALCRGRFNADMARSREKVVSAMDERFLSKNAKKPFTAAGERL